MYDSDGLDSSFVFSLGSGGRLLLSQDFPRLLVCQKDQFFLCLC